MIIRYIKLIGCKPSNFSIVNKLPEYVIFTNCGYFSKSLSVVYYDDFTYLDLSKYDLEKYMGPGNVERIYIEENLKHYKRQLKLERIVNGI